MPRVRFLPTTDFPYHVSARSNNKDWFSLPINESWAVFSHLLKHCSEEFNLRVHSFVLMSNHFHLLLSTPQVNLDKAMNYFLRESSKEMNRRAGRINHTFGAPYHRSLIDNPKYYDHAYKYIYRNPVEAGLCRRVEDYKYSSLRGVLGLDDLIFTTIDNQCTIQNPIQSLRWLNEGFSDPEATDFIRRALRRKVFEIPKDRKTRDLPEFFR